MSKKLLLFGICLLPLFAQAQRSMFLEDYIKIGQTEFVVLYDLSMVVDTTQPQEKQIDQVVLEIGKGVSKSYSYSLYRYDSIVTMLTMKGVNEISYPTPETPFVMDVYKYKNENKMMVTHRSWDAGPIFKYPDAMGLMEWQITSETKIMLGYSCQKATCRFRGREWSVWFTTEIPISEGPWKFSGLPGLVLKAEDSQGHYAFNCFKIKKVKKAIIMPDYYFEESTREKVWQYDKDCFDDIYAYALRIEPDAELVIDIIDDLGKTKEVVYKKGCPYKYSLPFNPIELE
ncbi:MAG: GLPGLI family protein [Bacteroidales bacterium]|nr:GLPGLI family protein [Bacteroidales bacterium]